MSPGIENSLICSQLLHKAVIRSDTTALLFHVLIGNVERPAMLLHCICYHLLQANLSNDISMHRLLCC